MADAPFIKFYPSDFLAGTSGLSPAERGVYITLLCLIYEADGPVALDEARLARRCGAPKNIFSRILEALVLEGKLTLEGGYLSNRRAEKALIDRQVRVQNSTMAASQKWKREKQKTQENQTPIDASASATQCVSDAIPEPEPDIEKPEANASVKKPRRKKPATRIEDDWQPSDADLFYARSKGFSQPQIEDMADGFRYHHLSKDSAFADWSAAWKNWCRNERKWTGGTKAGGYVANGNRPENNIVAEIARRRAAG
jgi:uncharacterized protein YdaU (DUF1376 family)